MPLFNSYTNISTADGTEEFVVAHAGDTKNITTDVLKTYIGAGLTLDSTPKTTGFTATVNTRYYLDTSGGQFTVTLPASPATGDRIAFVDYSGSFHTNKLTFGRNALKIMGLSEDLGCDVRYFAGCLEYAGTTKGWILV